MTGFSATLVLLRLRPGLLAGLAGLLSCLLICGATAQAQPQPTPEKPKSTIPSAAQKPSTVKVAPTKQSKQIVTKPPAPKAQAKSQVKPTSAPVPPAPKIVEQASKDDPNILDLAPDTPPPDALPMIMETHAPAKPLVTPSTTTVPESAAQHAFKPAATNDLDGLGNTDDQPLLLEEDQAPAAPSTTTRMMLRMTLSLVAVLIAMLAFLKWVLPALATRYPQFFNTLKQEQTAEATSGKRTRPSRSSQKQYLEHLGNGSNFQIVSSAALGKGRELHLVEIRGRQLVIATTPYTVTLVKDLTDPYGEANVPFHPDQATPASRNGNGSIGGLHGWAPTPDPLPEPSYHRLKTETYPEIPSHQKIKPKPFAEKMPNEAAVAMEAKTAASAYTASAAAASPLYLKYLNAEGLQDTADLQDEALDPVPTEEDVMVLEDYEDIYFGAENRRNRAWE